jgi:cytochrome c oxidase subunit 3
MPEPRPAFQYATLQQQHEAAQLGMWVFLATEVLFFGGLILAYLVYRHGYPADFAAAGRHTKIFIGTVNTALLLTSSFLVAWAVMAAKTSAGGRASLLLWFAAILGLVFLALKGVEYAQEYREHLVPGRDFQFEPVHAHGAELFFLIYFIGTCLHALHVTIGIAALAATGWRARQGRYSENYHGPITIAGLYWHFVDAVWILLFALIYLPGRNAS